MANQHLVEMRQRAWTNRAVADKLVANMSVGQLGWSPAPKSWSPIEVLEHLNGAAEKYHGLIHDALVRSRERGLQDDRSFRAGWLQRWFINQIEPKPQMRKLSAPSAYRPARGLPVDARSRDRFFELCDSLQELLGEAEGASISGVRFGSPVTPLLRLNVGEALWMLVAHEHRHLLQIQRICAHPKYPNS